MIDHAMTTTAFALEGYRTTKTLGVVRGVTVRSRSVIGTLGASLQTLIGGNITLLAELCGQIRGDRFALMLEHAHQLGANAVVGVRYEATEVMAGESGTHANISASSVALVPFKGTTRGYGPRGRVRSTFPFTACDAIILSGATPFSTHCSTAVR